MQTEAFLLQPPTTFYFLNKHKTYYFLNLRSIPESRVIGTHNLPMC